MKSWHKYLTKPAKVDITILGNKTLLRYFEKTTTHQKMKKKTDILEYTYIYTKYPVYQFNFTSFL